MPRYKPRLPFANVGGGDPELAITDSDWTRIEKAYGHKLPSELRSKIYDATWTFIALSDFEESAQPIAVARSRIKKIENAASILENAILEIPNGIGSGTAAYADHLISQNFRDTRINGKLKVIGSVMVSVVDACRAASLQLGKQTNCAPRKGTAWLTWVHKIESVAKKHDLPTQARKDTDKAADISSPFVKFLLELQFFLPKKYRRNRDSLAKAVHDARKFGTRSATPLRE